MDNVTSHQKGVGDIHSDERGAGARYNVGKIPVELIPLRLIAEQKLRKAGGKSSGRIDALFALARFQEGGGIDDLHDAIGAIGANWDECAAVFDYGRRKYAAWNWSKGMAWSVPLACAARHLVFGIMAGEENDSESCLSHRGHFLCNIVMLLTFLRTYPEGDDRPSKWLAQMGGMTEHIAREEDATRIAESNALAASDA